MVDLEDYKVYLEVYARSIVVKHLHLIPLYNLYKSKFSQKSIEF
jgi:hypothetical protein